MDFKRDFEPDQVVKVYTDRHEWFGVLKCLDTDECWIESLQWGHGWMMAKVLIQRRASSTFIIEAVPGKYGEENYLHHLVFFETNAHSQTSIRLGAIALMKDQQLLTEIVRDAQERDEGDVGSTRPACTIRAAALKRIKDRDQLEIILANKKLDEVLRNLAEDQLKSLPAPNRGGPYR